MKRRDACLLYIHGERERVKSHRSEISLFGVCIKSAECTAFVDFDIVISHTSSEYVCWNV